MTNNTAETFLSEDAQREANSFQNSRRAAASSSASSDAYVSRIQTLVLVLGAIILVLAGVLVYLVYQPPTTEVVLPTTSKAPVSDTVKAEMVTVVVAKDAIAPGTHIGPQHLALEEFSADARPEGSFIASDVSSLVGQYAAAPLIANAVITPEALSAMPTRSVPFEIPAGYRATTIAIDGRTGVEGFAKPGTFVDVLWYYSDESERQRVVTLVPRAKVLSVGGTTENQTLDSEKQQPVRSSMATILVTKKQAHSIELARNLGVLSLSLVGDGEEEPSVSDLEVTVNDILRPDAMEGPAVDGVVVSSNPVTGKQEKFVLKNRDWVDGEHEEGIDLLRTRFRRRFVSSNAGRASQRNASAASTERRTR